MSEDSHGSPLVLCSVRRHGTNEGVPAKLLSSQNGGGMPELGSHLRQAVQRQCKRCDPAARLFLAHRRRWRLPEHSCDWRRAPQRAATMRSRWALTAGACAATRPRCVSTEARALMLAHAHCDLQLRMSARWHFSVAARWCDKAASSNATAIAGPDEDATAPTFSPLRGTAAEPRCAARMARTAWPHALCRAYLRYSRGSRAVACGMPCSLRDRRHKQQRLSRKLLSARDRGGVQEPGGHRGRRFVRSQ
jgi:hypothetical protein